jgi:hypothetical protein
MVERAEGVPTARFLSGAILHSYRARRDAKTTPD